MMCFMPPNCFISVMMPVARRVFSVELSSTDDATKLRDTVSTGEFRALFIPAAKTYGEACFGVQLMQVCALLYGTYVLTWAVLQDDAFVAVFVDMLDYVIYKFASECAC
jgi:hypothetical protein